MPEGFNIIACLLILIFYELYIRWMTRRAPTKMAGSVHDAIRSHWVRSVMSRQGTEILVAQTLRNSVMAASFMATTAVLALSGTLTLSGIGSRDNALWQAVRAGDISSILFATKLLLLAASFFVSFLFMAMAVRFFNHAGYLITYDVGTEQALRRHPIAAAYLNRAGHHYSFGLRSFFTCVPFLAGLFSSYLMLPAAVLLVLILYWFDRVPYGE